MDKLLDSVEHLGVLWKIIIILWAFVNLAVMAFLSDKMLDWLSELKEGIKVGHFAAIVVFPTIILLAILIVVSKVIVNLIGKFMNIQIIRFKKGGSNKS